MRLGIKRITIVLIVSLLWGCLEQLPAPADRLYAYDDTTPALINGLEKGIINYKIVNQLTNLSDTEQTTGIDSAFTFWESINQNFLFTNITNRNYRIDLPTRLVTDDNVNLFIEFISRKDYKFSNSAVDIGIMKNSVQHITGVVQTSSGIRLYIDKDIKWDASKLKKVLIQQLGFILGMNTNSDSETLSNKLYVDNSDFNITDEEKLKIQQLYPGSILKRIGSANQETINTLLNDTEFLSVNNKSYKLGATLQLYDSNKKNVVREYNLPDSDSFSSFILPMLVDNKLYLIYSEGELFLFDDKNGIWTRKKNVPDAFLSFSSSSMENAANKAFFSNIYFAYLNNKSVYTIALWIYDAARDSWDYKKLDSYDDTSYILDGIVDFIIGNELYILYINSDRSTDFWSYNLSNGQLKSLPKSCFTSIKQNSLASSFGPENPFAHTKSNSTIIIQQEGPVDIGTKRYFEDSQDRPTHVYSVSEFTPENGWKRLYSFALFENQIYYFTVRNGKIIYYTSDGDIYEHEI